MSYLVWAFVADRMDARGSKAFTCRSIDAGMVARINGRMDVKQVLRMEPKGEGKDVSRPS